MVALGPITALASTRYFLASSNVRIPPLALKPGVFMGGVNRFQNDVGGLGRGGNFAFSGRGFDKIDFGFQAEFGRPGNFGGFDNFAGFENDFQRMLFAAGFANGRKIPAAIFLIAVKKAAIGKYRVDFVGAEFEGVLNFGLHGFYAAGAFGEIYDRGSFDFAAAEQAFDQRNEFGINADGSELCRKG